MKQFCWTVLMACLLSACSEGRGFSPFPFPAGTACPDFAVSTVGNIVRFCGVFNEENVDEIIRKFETEKYKIIVLDSLGGEIEPSIRLSYYLRDHDVLVLVNEICLSACAQYILMSSRRSGFRKNSLVAMHDTQYSTNLLRGEDVPDRIKYLSDIELRLYQNIGVEKELLIIPTAAMNIVCVEEYFSDIGPAGGMRVHSEFNWFVPSGDFLNAYYTGEFYTAPPSTKEVALKVGRLTKELGKFTGIEREPNYLWDVPACT